MYVLCSPETSLIFKGMHGFILHKLGPSTIIERDLDLLRNCCAADSHLLRNSCWDSFEIFFEHSSSSVEGSLDLSDVSCVD
jgi:hypothetical protein